MKKYIRKKDIFGHPIQLGFNKKGEFHQTTFGGICSVLVFVILVAYYGLNIKKMLLYEGDNI